MKKSLLISLGLIAGLQFINAGSVDRYAYDALGRLTSVGDDSGASAEAYRYDGAGNVVEKTLDGESYHFSYDAAHQLESVKGPKGLREYVYDAAGRLVAEVLGGEPVVKYTYGYLDKVTAVERNGEVTRFDYDAEGMLVGKQLSDGSYERWTWDGMALVARGVERYINEGHVVGGLPLVSQTSEGLRYHQHDHLGTTVASYDSDGGISAVYEATVFGDGELEANRAARFTGKPYDEDLGAYVFPFRNYNPEAARWMSADPIGFPDGPNNHFYAAVPTSEVDPLGLLKDFTDTGSDMTHTHTYSDGSTATVTFDVYNAKTDDDAHTIVLWKLKGSSPAGTDFSHNCHGYVFASGDYWIDNDQVSNILSGDGWKLTDNKKVDGVSKIALWGVDKHSAKVTGYDASDVVDEVTGKRGRTVGLHTGTPAAHWSGTPSYYEK